MKIDLGRLTQEETETLMQECMANLTEEQIFRVLEQTLTTNQKEELGEVWFNIDRKF